MKLINRKKHTLSTRMLIAPWLDESELYASKMIRSRFANGTIVVITI